MEWSVDTQGTSDLLFRFRAVRQFREDIVRTMELAALEAGAYMKIHAPFYSGALYQAIFISPVKFRPGGAGGGGFYEVEVGVDESQAPHVEFVIEGTGLFNRLNPKAGIFPAKGNVMVFESGTGTVFTAWTRGQRPQRAWFEDAMELASQIVERELHGIELGL